MNENCKVDKITGLENNIKNRLEKNGCGQNVIKRNLESYQKILNILDKIKTPKLSKKIDNWVKGVLWSFIKDTDTAVGITPEYLLKNIKFFLHKRFLDKKREMEGEKLDIYVNGIKT